MSKKNREASETPEEQGEVAEATEVNEVNEVSEVNEVNEVSEEIPLAIATKQLKHILEAILFASQKPMSAKELSSSLKGAAESGDPSAVAYAKTKEPALREALTDLAADCALESRTYEVRETAAGWQLVTRADFAPWLRQLFPENRPARLSAPALETLAIIAYRQPITRADIEAVRGVAVDGVMQTLMDRGLVRIAGRAEIPGRPLLYDTTQHFMEHFGLKDLDELPNSQELRKIELPKAEVPVAPEPAQTPETAPSPESSDVPSESSDPVAEAAPEVEEVVESASPEEPASSEDPGTDSEEPNPQSGSATDFV